jgi:flagellar hook-basal body complex protein FliE
MSSPFAVEPIAALPEMATSTLGGTQATAALHLPTPPSLAPIAGADASTAVSPFGSIVSAGLTDANDRLTSAETALQTLAIGGAGNLHAVMISMEGAKLAFQLVAQVRNHVLSAYQDIVKMQL